MAKKKIDLKKAAMKSLYLGAGAIASRAATKYVGSKITSLPAFAFPAIKIAAGVLLSSYMPKLESFADGMISDSAGELAAKLAPNALSGIGIAETDSTEYVGEIDGDEIYGDEYVVEGADTYSLNPYITGDEVIMGDIMGDEENTSSEIGDVM